MTVVLDKFVSDDETTVPLVVVGVNVVVNLTVGSVVLRSNVFKSKFPPNWGVVSSTMLFIETACVRASV